MNIKNMKKNTLFVGDCTELLAIEATKFDPSAVLIDFNNYNNFNDQCTEVTGYTSLADLPKDLSIFWNLLNWADKIIYCPPKLWSDRKSIDIDNPLNSMQGLTEYYLYATNKKKNNVIGLDLPYVDSNLYVKLNNTRDTDSKCLWVAGCSTTSGKGIKYDERYGAILSRQLNCTEILLAEPKTSIAWAADQILRSDIRAHDIVVWGLTNENRLRFWNAGNNEVEHVCVGHKTYIDKIDLSSATLNRLLVHQTNLYVAIQSIHQVVNFCNKIQAKLLIFNIHSSETLNLHLRDITEFKMYLNNNNTYLDLGTDNAHPGPNQHQAYADFCYLSLNQLNYI
jgi:hypothetical protein